MPRPSPLPLATTALLSLLLILLLSPSPALARCQWAALRGVTDQYTESLTTGLPDPLFAHAPYHENNRALSIASSALAARPLRIDFSRYAFDQEQCASYSELVVLDAAGGGPLVVGLQLRFNGSDGFSLPPDGASPELAAVLVDAVVTRPGDWLFDAGKTAAASGAEEWASILRVDQDTREVLRAGADAYLDLLEGKAGAVDGVVLAEGCARLDGGTASASCAVAPGAATGAITDRRYVIDETVGAVSVLAANGAMKGAADSHLFRFEGGELRYVHMMAATKAVA